MLWPGEHAAGGRALWERVGRVEGGSTLGTGNAVAGTSGEREFIFRFA